MLHLLLGSQVQPHVECGVCRQQPRLGGQKSPWCARRAAAVAVVLLGCSPGSRDTVQRLPGLQRHTALFLGCLAAPQGFRHTFQH